MKKENRKKLREMWGTPRYRALLILGCYLLFFVLVGTFIDFRGTSTDTQAKAEASSSPITLDKLNNYEFYYNFTYLGITDEPIKYFNLEGKRYDDREFLKIKETGDMYYKEKDTYFSVTDKVEVLQSPIFFEFGKIGAEKISTYIANAYFDSKTEFSDKTIKEVYHMSVNDFALLYMNDTVQIDGTIFIATYKKDKQIEKIELDLTAYNKMKIGIVYKNIKKIKTFGKGDLVEIIPGI